MTGSNKIWRAPVAGLASVAMLATLGVSALTANAAPTANEDVKPSVTLDANNGKLDGKATKTLTDDNTDGVLESTNALYDSANLPSRTGYEFTGWYTAKGAGQAVDPSTAFEDGTVLYAHWATSNGNDGKDKVNEVVFQGGATYGVVPTNGNVKTGANGKDVVVPLNSSDTVASWQIPTDKAGDAHLLEGFSAEKNGSVITDWSSVEAGDTVYAVTADAATVTITSGGADFDDSNTAYTISENHKTLTADVKVGDKLVAPVAYKDSGSKNYQLITRWLNGAREQWDFANDTVASGNLTLQANGEDMVDATVINVRTQKGDSGSWMLAMKRGDNLSNIKSALAQFEQRDGFTFDGWFAAWNDGPVNDVIWAQKADQLTPIQTAVAADYAMWGKWTPIPSEPNTYTITFDYNYDGAPDPVKITVTEGDYLETPADPTREGYEFQGWAGTPDASAQDVENLTDMIVDSTSTNIYYAVWAAVDDVTNAEDLYKAWSYPVVDTNFQKNHGSVSEMFTEASMADYNKVVKEVYREMTSGQRNALNADSAVESTLEDVFTDEEAGKLLDTLKDAQAKLVFKKTAVTPVYRVFNKATLKHHYTMNKVEVSNLLAQGWKAEGVNGVAFYVPAYGDGKYTNETNAAVAAGFIMPVYRVFNKYDASGKQIDRHFFTSNEAEYESLCNDATWRDEGIGWYTRVNGGDPVYRTYSSARYEHLFSTNQTEAENSVSLYGYRDEGVAFRAE